MKNQLIKFFVTLSIFFISPSFADQGNNDISFYTGTFDVIDKEGDDKTSLVGI